jgi:hypothetical protein
MPGSERERERERAGAQGDAALLEPVSAAVLEKALTSLALGLRRNVKLLPSSSSSSSSSSGAAAAAALATHAPVLRALPALYSFFSLLHALVVAQGHSWPRVLVRAVKDGCEEVHMVVTDRGLDRYYDFSRASRASRASGAGAGGAAGGEGAGTCGHAAAELLFLLELLGALLDQLQGQHQAGRGVTAGASSTGAGV